MGRRIVWSLSSSKKIDEIYESILAISKFQKSASNVILDIVNSVTVLADNP